MDKVELSSVPRFTWTNPAQTCLAKLLQSQKEKNPQAVSEKQVQEEGGGRVILGVENWSQASEKRFSSFLANTENVLQDRLGHGNA